MTALQHQVGKFAASIAQQALNCGLTWEQAVSALGLATKILVNKASNDEPEAMALAQKHFADGLAQPIVGAVAEFEASGLPGTV